MATIPNHKYIGTQNQTPMSAWDAALDAGALFPVSFTPVPLPDGTVPPSGHMQIVRTDTNVRLGMHSDKYPHTDYANVVAQVEELFPQSTLAVTLFGDGERVALTQQLAEPIDLGGGDLIQPNLLWVTSYNGTWSTCGMHTTFRYFCTNQMPASVKLVKVRKTTKHDEVLADRMFLLKVAIEASENVAARAQRLRQQELDDIDFRQIVAGLMKQPDEDAPTRTITNWRNRHSAVMANWRAECDGPSAYTAWAAYSALQAADYHDMPTVNARGLRTVADRIERSTVALVDRDMQLSDRFLTLV